MTEIEVEPQLAAGPIIYGPNLPLWLQPAPGDANLCYTAQDYRFSQSILFPGGGISKAGDFLVTQVGTGNNTVDIAPGSASIPGNTIAHQGNYFVYNASTKNLQPPGPPATNNRYDCIILGIEDGQVTATHQYRWYLQCISGAEAASPTPPTIPNDAMLLARILRKPSQTNILAADIVNVAKLIYDISGFATKAPGPRTDAVTHLYRNDDPAGQYPGYIVTSFDGSRFRLYGVNNTDVEQYGVRVYLADVASTIYNVAGSMAFHWSDPGGQPVYVWGANDPATSRVYNVRAFAVAYADNAGYANSSNYSNGAGNATNSDNCGGIPAWRFVDKSADAGMNGIYYFQNTGHGFRYPGIQGTTSAANAYITGAPTRGLMVVTSSQRYKNNIELSPIDWHPLLHLPVKKWEDDSDGDHTWHGLIAEDVADAVPEIATHDADGLVENYHTGSMIAGLIALLREAYQRIETLETKTA